MKFYVYTDYTYSFTSDVEIRDDGIYFPNEDVFVSFNRWPRNMSPDRHFTNVVQYYEVPDTFTMHYLIDGVQKSFEATIDKTYTFLPVSMKLEEPVVRMSKQMRDEFSFWFKQNID